MSRKILLKDNGLTGSVPNGYKTIGLKNGSLFLLSNEGYEPIGSSSSSKAVDLSSVLYEGGNTGANNIIVNRGQMITTAGGEKGSIYGYGEPFNSDNFLTIGDIYDPVSPPTTGITNIIGFFKNDLIITGEDYDGETRVYAIINDGNSFEIAVQDTANTDNFSYAKFENDQTRTRISKGKGSTHSQSNDEVNKTYKHEKYIQIEDTDYEFKEETGNIAYDPDNEIEFVSRTRILSPDYQTIITHRDSGQTILTENAEGNTSGFFSVNGYKGVVYAGVSSPNGRSDFSLNDNGIYFSAYGTVSSTGVTIMQDRISMNSQSKFESIVDSGFVSSSIVQNASNVTTTSDEIWMFAGMSGIEMSSSQIDLSSTKFNYNGSEVARKNDTGWASYKDTTYTSGSPFTILDTVTSTLPNNAGTVINTELPEGVSSFYNSITSKITPQFVGDYYIFTIRFKAKTTATLFNPRGGYGDFGIDIGGMIGVVSKETFIFPKGAGVEHNFTITCPMYVISTPANGVLVKLTAGGGDLTVYDIEYQIARVHKKI